MSVKYALLALLAHAPQGVYRLRTYFEQVTAGQWPLNIGQVYSTMQRLQRDNLVKSAGTEPAVQAGLPDVELFELTDEGRKKIAQWWIDPVDRTRVERDEYVIKLAVALEYSIELAQEVIDTQRFSTLNTLQQLNRQKRSILLTGTAHQLIIERQSFLLEAELRWLDHIEKSLGSRSPKPQASSSNDQKGQS
ncbi:MAG: PadR family transcriptional regulator [Actinomycetaceae bacterium]|nr:PadR family transcriptional regulator [Actinomycetaceae bacterium]